MDRDALRAETFDVDGGFQDVGHIASARIAQEGDLIDIYT
jgi:hypothetical protein